MTVKPPIPLRHLLWRMDHVAAESEIVTARRVGDDLGLGRLTFGQSVIRIRRLAAGLTPLGFGAGDTVATLAWNSDEHVEALLVVPTLGAMLNNINLRLQPEALKALIGDPKPSLRFVDADLLGDNALVMSAFGTVQKLAASPGRRNR